MFFTTLSFVFCRHTFANPEHWHTFYNDADPLMAQITQVGGFARLGADFLCQYFIHPTTGILINAFLLAVISMEMSSHLARISMTPRLLLLPLLPTLALLFVEMQSNYLYEGTVGFLLMLMLLNIRKHILNKYVRRAYTIVASFLLYWLAGPMGMLFALTLLVSRFSPFAFFPFTIAFLLGGISLRLGHQESLCQLLTPEAYFSNGNSGGPFLAWLSWILWLIILVIGLTIRYRPIPKWIIKNIFGLQLTLVLAFTIYGLMTYIE